MMMSFRIPARRPRAGFTLIELLVTIGIMGIVSGLGLRTYFLATDYYGQAQSEGESDMAAQTALQTLREDVSSVLPSSLTGVSIVGALQKSGAGEADSVLVLPVSVPTFTDGRMTAASVKYHVQRIKTAGGLETARLVRTAVPLHQAIPDSAGAGIAIGVIAFRVEYLDDEGRWLHEWPSGTSPLALRVSLTLRDPDSILAPAITRSLVFRVPAR